MSEGYCNEVTRKYKRTVRVTQVINLETPRQLTEYYLNCKCGRKHTNDVLIRTHREEYQGVITFDCVFGVPYSKYTGPFSVRPSIAEL